MLVLLASTLLMVGSRLTWYRLLPLHLRNLGASDQQVGLVFTVILLLGPTQLLGGIISDRWGRRYVITIPTLILAPILVLGSQARHWLALAIIVWIIAFFAGGQQPGFQALLAESAADENRGRVFGGFLSIMAVAFMVGPAVGAALLPFLGIKGLILINAAGATLSGLLRLLFLREGQFAGERDLQQSVRMRDIFRVPAFRWLLVIHSLHLLLLQGLTRDGPFIAIHAADSLKLSEQAVNWLFAVGQGGAVLAALVGGTLADRLGGKRVGGAGFLLHTLLLIAWGITGSLPAWLGYTLFGLSFAMLQVGMAGYLMWYSAFAPSSVRGRVLGMVGAVAAFSSAPGPQIGTWIRAGALSLAAGASPPWVGQLASAAPFILALAVALVFSILLAHIPRMAADGAAPPDRQSAAIKPGR